MNTNLDKESLHALANTTFNDFIEQSNIIEAINGYQAVYCGRVQLNSQYVPISNNRS